MFSLFLHSSLPIDVRNVHQYLAFSSVKLLNYLSRRGFACRDRKMGQNVSLDKKARADWPLYGGISCLDIARCENHR